MKKLTVVRAFTDARKGVPREIGDAFTADDQRAEQLRQLGYVTAEDVPEKKKRKSAKE